MTDGTLMPLATDGSNVNDLVMTLLIGQIKIWDYRVILFLQLCSTIKDAAYLPTMIRETSYKMKYYIK